MAESKLTETIPVRVESHLPEFVGPLNPLDVKLQKEHLDANFEREQKALDSKAKRERETRNHYFLLSASAVVGLFCIYLVYAASTYIIAILTNKDASPESRQAAAALAGAIFGAAATFIFTGLFKVVGGKASSE